MDNWLDKMAQKSDYAQRMKKEHKCIICGIKLKPEIWEGEEYYPHDTCTDCFLESKQVREGRELTHAEARRFGAGASSMHHEGLRRI